jgi:hypothetical protein
MQERESVTQDSNGRLSLGHRGKERSDFDFSADSMRL